VISIGEDGAATSDARIQATSQANSQTLHRARKPAMSVHLDDEMNVIRLNRKLHQARAEALPRRTKSRKHERSERPLAQARKPLASSSRAPGIVT
jgi:hypothetical protein